ncbi:carbon storage regulator [Oceanobacillus profundus]|uniref:Carbon storage regulator n=1 Tax=Oceanobacillus profundus TaxID=372463 RepID=A0A417YGB9_9BACI|nr:carbon storage regulator [Oceanobacillus profundus]MBR2246288.1 carbon storage regulator [Bacilli bacterium]MBR3119697.1 carbon storage regulator [Oceanobacillus sp.]RHW31857.1 carbon storage regulator [Oceanobacillus profundus]
MALVLGRKVGEKVVIQDDQGREVEIKVIKGEGGLKHSLKLRISAPQEFNIIRGEIYDGNNS